MNKSFIAIALFLLFVSLQCQGDELIDGLEAYQRGNYEVALKTLLPLAEDGDRDLQHMVATMYVKGFGTEQSYKAAAHWFERAAEQGHPAAAYTVALFYEHGRGVEPNPAQAFRWLKRAAQGGVDEAQYKVGLAYDEGVGVDADAEIAAHWYRLATDQGHAWAMNNLGLLYDTGHGVPEDPSRACDLFLLSAAQGNLFAYYNLASHYRAGRGVEQDHSQALVHFYEAAKRGHVESQSMLAVMAYEGSGVEQSYFSAYVYAFVAATNGSDVANRNLDRIGEKLSEDDKMAAVVKALELLNEWKSADDTEESDTKPNKTDPISVRQTNSVPSKSNQTVGEVVARIFEAIEADDAEFAINLKIGSLLQQAHVGDPIGAASEDIMGRYGPIAPDGPLLAWLNNTISSFEKVYTESPELCSGYMSGSTDALVVLYDELFTIEDNVNEVEIVELIVRGAIESPVKIDNLQTTEAELEQLILITDQWAAENDVDNECGYMLKLFKFVRDKEASVAADLMRLNFTYE